MKKFNEAQMRAITHVDGPMMVLAGPGSGKTTVITHRVKYLIEEAGVDPGNILVVTFTKAAAATMKNRFKILMGNRYVPVSFGTFHSIFFTILKAAYGYSAEHVVDTARKQTIFKEIIENRQLDTEDVSEFIDNIESEISVVKGDMMPVAHYYPTGCSKDVFTMVYQDYERLLRQYHLLDFDDMMIYTYELFSARKDILKLWQQKYKYILIDEFQDVNRLQYEIIKMMADPLENLFIVGDDDQSIYHFRGARPEFMLGFERDYPQVKKTILNINYRSSDMIVAAAERCICHNTQRFAKQMRAVFHDDRQVHVRIYKNPKLECEAVSAEIRRLHAAGMPYEQMAVLFRTNNGSRMIVSQLMGDNVPFKMKDRLPNMFEHWIMKQITAYIRVAAGSEDRRDFLQIINRPNRYISRQCLQNSKITLDEIRDYYEDKPWMLERIETLEEDLHVIDQATPVQALHYIRKTMGYEKYLYEYALDRKIPPEEYIEIFDYLEESARPYKTYGAWFEYIDQYTEQIRRKESASEQELKEAVALSTMHSAKGLEYDAVFIIDANEGIMPYQKALLDEDIEEERRMFYVAMTRARSVLEISLVKERHGKPLEPSRFVEELK